MITWNETSIIVAVIGMVGLLSSFAVVSRSLRANDTYQRRLKKRQLQLQVCEVCNGYICKCES